MRVRSSLVLQTQLLHAGQQGDRIVVNAWLLFLCHCRHACTVMVPTRYAAFSAMATHSFESIVAMPQCHLSIVRGDEPIQHSPKHCLVRAGCAHSFFSSLACWLAQHASSDDGPYTHTVLQVHELCCENSMLSRAGGPNFHGGEPAMSASSHVLTRSRRSWICTQPGSSAQPGAALYAELASRGVRTLLIPVCT